MLYYLITFVKFYKKSLNSVDNTIYLILLFYLSIFIFIFNLLLNTWNIHKTLILFSLCFNRQQAASFFSFSKSKQQQQYLKIKHSFNFFPCYSPNVTTIIVSIVQASRKSSIYVRVVGSSLTSMISSEDGAEFDGGDRIYGLEREIIGAYHRSEDNVVLCDCGNVFRHSDLVRLRWHIFKRFFSDFSIIFFLFTLKTNKPLWFYSSFLLICRFPKKGSFLWSCSVWWH